MPFKKARRLGNGTFLILWVLTHIVLTTLSAYADLSVREWLFTDGVGTIEAWLTFILPFVVLIPLALAQKSLLRYGYGLRLRGWLRASIGAALITQLLSMTILPGLYNIISTTVAASSLPLLSVTLYVLPLALTQWFVLRKHLQGAWVWVPITIIGSGLVQLFGLYQWLMIAEVQVGIPSVTASLLTGAALLWMLHLTGNAHAHAQASAVTFDETEASARLVERSTPPANQLPYDAAADRLSLKVK